MMALVERALRALQRFEAHRAGDVGEGRQARGIEKCESAEPRHVLCAVDERETFFRFELDRFDSRARQRFASRHERAFETRFPFADEDEREVRERRQIARRADRSLGGNPRYDAAIEHLQKSLDDDVARAGVPERKNLRPQDDHRAHLVFAEIGADAARVAAHEVALQGAHVALRDVHLGKRAEPGVDAVDGARIVAALKAIDDRARTANRFERFGRQDDGPRAARDVFEIHEAHRATDGKLGRKGGVHGAAA
jgi:hypothetical protein